MKAQLKTDANLRAKVKRDLAALLYEQGTNGCIVIIITSSAAALVTTSFEFVFSVYLWWTAITTLILIRIVDIRLFLKNIANSEFDGSYYIKRFTILSLLAAALFGFFPFLSYSMNDPLDRSLIVLILSGIAGGATTVLSADKFLAMSYNSLLLVPPSLLALFKPEYDLELIGLLGILYWIILSISIQRSSNFIYNAAHLHHHNEELLDALGEEKFLAEESTQKLQQAYAEINSTKEALEYKVEARTKALSIMASTDELTGLKNRHTFVKTLNDTIQKAKSKDQQFSILFVDLDGFKEINDIRGHLVGDKVLKSIAERLQKSVKHKDFLCRWGGDEFVLVVDEHEPLLLDTISTRLCQTVQQPIKVDFDNIKITASIGIATYPTHGSNTTELVNAADVAMYELKKGGKNGSMLFESAFLEKIRFEQHLLNGLSCAIENQEFDLYYQPIIPCDETSPVLFEGLIRWKFGEAYIPPVIFIPIAESCDTIFDVGNWILERACHDISNNNLGNKGRISINISVRQLLARGFVEQVTHCLKDYNISGKRLQFEITESVFANNLNLANTVLNKLRDLEITIALDDFGCGFSSLSYLQSLPIDIIKIDQSFVSQIDSGGAKIIEATVSIAEAFGCKVISEGVETLEQHQRLGLLRVDYMQGFYIAKPAPYFDLDSCWFVDEEKRKSS